MFLQKLLSRKSFFKDKFYVGVLKFNAKRAGSGSKSGSRSISQSNGSADPDPDPHEMSWIPEHCTTIGIFFGIPCCRTGVKDGVGRAGGRPARPPWAASCGRRAARSRSGPGGWERPRETPGSRWWRGWARARQWSCAGQPPAGEEKHFLYKFRHEQCIKEP